MQKIAVYVAGASREPERTRAREIMERVRQSEVLCLAHDWVSQLAAEAIPDRELTRAEAARYSGTDLHHVMRAQVLWLLVPSAASTIGAWVEFGTACGIKTMRTDRLIVASGDCKSSIFCAQAEEFETDEQAYARIVAWALSQQSPSREPAHETGSALETHR
jgi:hypothetical protein